MATSTKNAKFVPGKNVNFKKEALRKLSDAARRLIEEPVSMVVVLDRNPERTHSNLWTERGVKMFFDEIRKTTETDEEAIKEMKKESRWDLAVSLAARQLPKAPMNDQESYGESVHPKAPDLKRDDLTRLPFRGRENKGVYNEGEHVWEPRRKVLEKLKEWTLLARRGLRPLRENEITFDLFVDKAYLGRIEWNPYRAWEYQDAVDRFTRSGSLDLDLPSKWNIALMAGEIKGNIRPKYPDGCDILGTIKKIREHAAKESNFGITLEDPCNPGQSVTWSIKGVEMYADMVYNYKLFFGEDPGPGKEWEFAERSISNFHCSPGPIPIESESGSLLEKIIEATNDVDLEEIAIDQQ